MLVAVDCGIDRVWIVAQANILYGIGTPLNLLLKLCMNALLNNFQYLENFWKILWHSLYLQLPIKKIILFSIFKILIENYPLSTASTRYSTNTLWYNSISQIVWIFIVRIIQHLFKFYIFLVDIFYRQYRAYCYEYLNLSDNMSFNVLLILKCNPLTCNPLTDRLNKCTK